ncbi:hypothetical protein JMN32_04490 [Fulvivirga sp. 29W222]|uniref:Uncharacterized protein n=1 Tax=Fulvivirga marina TaxID=2494733 RepID=A0A937FW27_9BACT|nr:hypothetical protein [Fulvivirga marina]MBL6445553.1 hypothetical protein [Fulvivirga marina]
MSTNILGSANFEKISLGNGSSYTPITAKFPILDIARPLWVSDFSVEPPRVKIDPSMKDIVERISKSLATKSLKYKSRQRKDWSLKEIMKDGDSNKINAKSKLVRDGFSAVIAEVSKMLNKSSIDHTSKFLLSNEPLYVYALSFVIYYEKVKDAEGINDRVITLTENEIKPFFNILLARAAIEQRHLNLSIEQRKDIYKAASNTNISYVKGMPAGAISKIIAKYVDNGSIHDLVDRFFASGEIDPAKGTPQIRQLMVNYLKEIGLVIPEDIPDEDSDDISFTDLEAIEEDVFESDNSHDDDVK